MQKNIFSVMQSERHFIAHFIKFDVTWSTATPEVRAFIEEVTRVTYEREKAKRNGVSLSTVKPFFGDTAC